MAFYCEQRVDWGDCDEAGLVFYPNYFRWMDAAFHRLCAAAGHSQRSLQNDHGVFGTPLIDADCKFIAPATYNECLQIGVVISYWGTSSMRLEYHFERDGQAVATGKEARVWVKREAGRIGKTIIPAALREALNAVTEHD